MVYLDLSCGERTQDVLGHPWAGVRLGLDYESEEEV